MSSATANEAERFGYHGKILIADLTTESVSEELIDDQVYRQFLGGYGLGAYLMWKHFPAGTDPLAWCAVTWCRSMR